MKSQLVTIFYTLHQIRWKAWYVYRSALNILPKMVVIPRETHCLLLLNWVVNVTSVKTPLHCERDWIWPSGKRWKFHCVLWRIEDDWLRNPEKVTVSGSTSMIILLSEQPMAVFLFQGGGKFISVRGIQHSLSAVSLNSSLSWAGSPFSLAFSNRWGRVRCGKGWDVFCVCACGDGGGGGGVKAVWGSIALEEVRDSRFHNAG